VSGLAPLLGHGEVRHSLARALERGDLPGSLLLHGPVGVGKQRLGLWLGQRLLCSAPGDPEPCGRCANCRFSLRIEHPDLHWFFPLARPKSVGSADKLSTALEDARAAELAARRAEPYRGPRTGENLGIFVAQMQTLRRIAIARPSLGRRKLILVGDAERLVPQESSPEAANALLKVLEEPPADTTLVLTVADPEGLLPTLRSRCLPVRLNPLPLEEVEAFLISEFQLEPPTAHAIAQLSQGCPGQALGFKPGPDGPGPLESQRQQAREWLEAAVRSDPLTRLAAAHRLAPSGARGTFADTLGFLGLWLRDLAAQAAGAEALVVNTDAKPLLAELAAIVPGSARGAAAAGRLVEEALAMGRNNVNPQLTLAWLLEGLRQALHEA
jgi:DNA polymerase-3 subunit delta'